LLILIDCSIARFIACNSTRESCCKYCSLKTKRKNTKKFKQDFALRHGVTGVPHFFFLVPHPWSHSRMKRTNSQWRLALTSRRINKRPPNSAALWQRTAKVSSRPIDCPQCHWGIVWHPLDWRCRKMGDSGTNDNAGRDYGGNVPLTVRGSDGTTAIYFVRFMSKSESV